MSQEIGFLECSLAKGRLHEGHMIEETVVALDIAMEFVHSFDHYKALVEYLLCAREWA